MGGKKNTWNDPEKRKGRATLMMRSRLLNADGKDSHPSSAIACSRWVVVRCCGHHSQHCQYHYPPSYSLGTPFYITSSLSSPSQIIFLHTKNPIFFFLFFLHFSLSFQSFFFSSFAMFSKSKLTIFFLYYIFHYNCHPSFCLFSISIYFMTSLNFYFPFLISYYKHFPFLSFTHLCIFFSLIHFSISEENCENHNNLTHNSLQNTTRK